MATSLTILDWVFAALLGFLLTQFLKFYVSWPAPPNSAKSLYAVLRDFSRASSDRVRQSLALQSARYAFHFTLLLSLPLSFAAFLLSLIHFSLGIDVASVQFLEIATLAGIATWYGHRLFSANQNKPTQSYGPWSRILHHVVLDFKSVRKSTFQFSLHRFKPNPKRTTTAESDVLIMGMARSGTSLVLRLISQDSQFSVLRYKDMPFVLAPAFWRRISQAHSQPIVSIERKHNDGLLNNLESPEAFEEVFWETFRNKKDSDKYFDNKPNSQALENFRAYKDTVCSIGKLDGGRYLSKNNNSLLRMVELAHDQQNLVLFVYREPQSAAASMHRVHTRFCDLLINDQFAKSYINWLAHFEFGPHHKPFEFAKPFMCNEYSVRNLDYWLDYWCAVHRHILNQAPGNCVFVNYDQLCDNPQHYLNALEKRLNSVFASCPIGNAIKRIPNQLDPFNVSQLSLAKSIYEQLRNDPRNLLLKS